MVGIWLSAVLTRPNEREVRQYARSGRCERSFGGMHPRVWGEAAVLALTLLLPTGAACTPILSVLERVDVPGLAGVYFVRPSKDDNRVHLRLIVLAGEADNRGTEGIAHYAEHLAWYNARITQDSRFDRHSNATTNLLSTTYWVSGNPEDVDELVEGLLRVLEPLALPVDFMREERDIVLREYQYRVAEDPYAPLHDDLRRRLHGDNPVARSLLGRPDDIASFSLDEARAFHRATHRPENTVLVVQGPVSRDDLLRVVQRTVGPRTAVADVAPPPYVMGPPVRDLRTRRAPGLVRPVLLYYKLVELPETGSPSEPGLSELRLRLALLYRVLDSTLPGSIARPLRFERFVAESYTLELDAFAPRHVLLGFFARPDRGVSLEALMRELETTIAEIAEHGIPDRTFIRIRQRYVDGLRRRDDPEKLAVQEITRVADSRTGETPRGPFEIRADAWKITREQLDALMRALAGPGRVVATKAFPVDG